MSGGRCPNQRYSQPEANSLWTSLCIFCTWKTSADYCELAKALLVKDGLAADIVLVEDLEEFTAAFDKGRVRHHSGGLPVADLHGNRRVAGGAPAVSGHALCACFRDDRRGGGDRGDEGAGRRITCSSNGQSALGRWCGGRCGRRESQHARRQAEVELRRRDGYLRALTENSLDVLSHPQTVTGCSSTTAPR